jgi:hypothetical protein
MEEETVISTTYSGADLNMMVVDDGPCWRWVGVGIMREGAAALMWQLEHSALPEGFALIGFCANSGWCVKPAHHKLCEVLPCQA